MRIELRTPAQIAELAPSWERWLPAESELFETPAWAEYRLRGLPPNYEGGVALASDDEGPAFLLPFRWQRSLAWIPTGVLQTQGLGAHRPGVDAEASRLVVTRALLHERRAYAARIESRAGQEPPERMRIAPLHGRSGTVSLGNDIDSFLAMQTARFRKHVRYAMRQMEKGGWAIDDLTRAGAEAIERANLLHDACLNHKFASAYRGAYRSTQRDEALLDVFGPHVRIFALRRGAAEASIVYGIKHGDTFYLLRQGNDPAHFSTFRESASLTLRAAMIPRLQREGVRTLEVVGGTEGLWQTRPPTRVALEWRSSRPQARATAALARAIAANHRRPSITALRRGLGRVAPQLSKNAI